MNPFNRMSAGVTLIELSICLAICAMTLLGLLSSYRQLASESQKLQLDINYLPQMVALLESYPAHNQITAVSEIYLQIQPTNMGCVFLSVSHPSYKISLTRLWCG